MFRLIAFFRRLLLGSPPPAVSFPCRRDSETNDTLTGRTERTIPLILGIEVIALDLASRSGERNYPTILPAEQRGSCSRVNAIDDFVGRLPSSKDLLEEAPSQR